MLEAERQLAIVTEIKSSVGVSVSRLAQKFGVSANTIRRDLEKLEKAGIVKRIHGGAVLNDPGGYDLPFEERQIEHKDEKDAIGALASSLVGDGDTIIIDAGTTCLSVAKHIKSRPRKDLTVLTNSVAVATELSNNPGIVVILCGGMVRGLTLSLVGPPAEEFFESVHVDKLFLATGGISPDKGILTNPNMHEVPVKKRMMGVADEIIVVADSHKFGRVALCPFAELGNVHKVVTDSKVSGEARRLVEAFGPEVIVA
ncbi:MAG TPA: DeoR/GlpR transcriptional regulator [Firmicutes bacterium]|nr:DeoR/GlpR transcriptional regulator [Bacillota bacterium]